MWFNNFLKRYTPGQSDYYVLFGLYPDYATGKPIDAKKYFWQPIILCFPDGQMRELLESVLTKEEKKPDRFFYVEFNSRKRVYGTRGFADGKRDLTSHLLEKQLKEIRKRLGA